MNHKFLSVLLLMAVMLVAGCTSNASIKKTNNTAMGGSEAAVEKPVGIGYIMENSTMIIEDNGKFSFMKDNATLNDGTIVTTSGSVNFKNGSTIILKNEESIWSDGSIMEKSMLGHEGEVTEQSGDMIENNASSSNTTRLQKIANNYYRYDPIAYQEALADKKTVFLDFHANWCPVCNAERPGILEGTNSINYTDVIGFEVHYNDNETKDFDNDLIKQFQVAYQHTKIIINKNGKTTLKTLEVFDKDRVISEIDKARSA